MILSTKPKSHGNKAHKIISLICFFASIFSLTTITFAQNVGVNTTGTIPSATNMFEVLQPSATNNTVGIYVEHSGTPTTGYAFKAIANGVGVNNVAAYLSATNGTTSNYALIVPSNSGNVGIGTTTPGSLLEINGGYVSAIKNADNSLVLNYSYNSVGASTTSHFVGHRARGTSASPTHPLADDALAAFQGRNGAASNSWSGMSVFASENHTAAAQGTYLSFYTVAGGTITPTDRMIISSTGNIGINEPAPDTKLHINYSAGPGIIIEKANQFPALELRESDDERWHIGSATDRFLLTHYTNVAASAEYFFHVENNGNVGIGYGLGVNAAEKLDVNGNIVAQGNVNATGTYQLDGVDVIYLSGADSRANLRVLGNLSATNQDGMYLNYNSTGTTAAHLRFYANGVTERMRIDANSGHVGIGTATPSQRLTVYNGSTTGTYTTTGWAHSSDRRLKTNIQPINNALDKVMKLNGVYYNWKDNINGNRQVGFIAQDVEPVIPEVVIKDENGNYSLSYGNLTSVLLNAIKEQQQTIETLKLKNNEFESNDKALKAENECLKTRMDKLEAIINQSSKN